MWELSIWYLLSKLNRLLFTFLRLVIIHNHKYPKLDRRKCSALSKQATIWHNSTWFYPSLFRARIWYSWMCRIEFERYYKSFAARIALSLPQRECSRLYFGINNSVENRVSPSEAKLQTLLLRLGEYIRVQTHARTHAKWRVCVRGMTYAYLLAPGQD